MSNASQAAAPPLWAKDAKIAPRRKYRVATVVQSVLAIAICVSGSIAGWRYAHTQPVPVVRFQTVTADRGPIAAKVTASGTVSALVTVQVGSQDSGRIQAWYADFNAPVKKGQLIALIEPYLFEAAVAQARANYEAARATYDKAVANSKLDDLTYQREATLFKQNLVARADLDSAEAAAASARADVEGGSAAMLQAKAALDQAVLNLSYTRIISPIDGIVISRNIDVGQTVAASFQAPTLFTIAQDLTKMQVDTNVAEGDVGKIREKMEATFTVDAYPTRTFRGVVRQVRDNATTIQNVVTYDAVIDVDNSELALRPTMTANATFVYATTNDALRIPNAALRFKPNASSVSAMTFGTTQAAPGGSLAPDQRVVWVLAGRRASPKVVRVGITDGMWTEVTEGDVRPGESIVSEATVVSSSTRRAF